MVCKKWGIDGFLVTRRFLTITGGHINQDARLTQKDIHTPIFTHHIRF